MPRTFRHWTPRYIVNRLMLAYHQRVSPRAPWLTKDACSFLAEWLDSSDVGLEWGCGRSTIWFAERIAKLTSVEHDEHWYRLVKSQLEDRAISNVDLRLVPVTETSNGNSDPYATVGHELARESLDFVLVDGQLRDQCAQVALSRLKPGGILIIDNVEWYIPHDSPAPGALARTGSHVSGRWKSIAAELRAWRCIWTSNGVWDTAVYCKPVAR